MKHNDIIRQEYRDTENTLIMSTNFNSVPFSSEYTVWLEDELNKLRIADVSQRSELLLQAYKDGFDSATESLLAANKMVQDRKLQ
jgi:hypothetical protein